MNDTKSTHFNPHTSYVHDNANRLTSRIYPNGITTTYEYDGMSRLTRLKDGTLFDRQYSYNAADQISQISELAARGPLG